ncbi:MAG: response regulator [Candidatus Eisenbacteria bacterium]|nr:response regulator [Candidatus Eisenbacteria bacterium]
MNAAKGENSTDKRTVLVVDDEEAIRDSCRQVLTKAGFDCHSAVDGIEGLHVAHQVEPDVILLDLMMPGIDGLSVLTKVLETHPNTVCIVITGYATIESAVDAMKKGAFDFLPKPFTPEELRLIVTRGLEQRRLLQETAELRAEKERMKQYFITIVAHELRSPLLLVKQYLDLIVGGKMGTIDDTAKEMLEGAHGTLTGLLDIIADWLELSRITAGDIAGGMQETDLWPVLESVVEDMKPFAEEKSVSLRLDPPPETCKVTADPKSMAVVFKNLVSNAVKYNLPDGSVTIEGLCADGNLRVQVRDTGIGIPEKELPFVFEDFFRVTSSKTADIPGTGLGLSIVKKIVEGHHGTVGVESSENEGAAFEVQLPLVHCDEEEAEEDYD